MAKITVHGGASNAAAEDEAADETTEQAGEESSEASEEPAPPEQDYEDATVDELKELLAARGLSKTGKRDDLVARLREDDATRAAGAE